MADDPEAIALRVHQIAVTAGVLAEAAAQPTNQGDALSHALYLIEACLLDVEARIERLGRKPSPRDGDGAHQGGNERERPR